VGANYTEGLASSIERPDMNTVRNRDTDWKQRYLDLLEQQEKQQARNKRKQGLLVAAVVKLVQFGRDLDADADDKLLAMRGLVRRESFPNVDLASVVEALEAQIDTALKSRKKHQKEVAQELARLTKQVQSVSQQKDLQSELTQLQKAIDARPLQLATVADHLLSLNELYTRVRKESKSGQSLVQRWFGSNENSLERGNSPELKNSPEQAPELTLDSVSDHLAQLLQEIEPGESMQGTFDVASQILSDGLTAENIDIAIQSVTDVVLAAISRDRQEMTGYLSQMNQRLQEATTGLAASQAILKEEIAASQGFGESVQASVGQIRQEVDVQSDLASLKDCINENLDQMMLAVEARQTNGTHLQTELSDQLKHLVERAKFLEEQGQEAEKRVAEQRQRALTDSLTSLPNREAYEESAAREVDRWQRYGRPLCMAVCDIDLFKTVNDSHGHAAGDEALKQVAQIISHRLRGSDFVARYGGEEFVVLLPETEREAAATVMESVREAVEMSHIAWEKKRLNLTISIGISDFKGKDILQSAFTRADRALYQAKMNGRNRVELALD
jgi:diguanylate cyclase